MVRMPLRNSRQNPDDQRVSLVHHTDDGLVHLLVLRDRDGGWRGTIFGDELACARSFEKLADANRYVQKSFKEMFPEHCCTSACGSANEEAQRVAAAAKNFWSLD